MAIVRQVVGHVFLLAIAIPAILFTVSLFFGAIIAKIEGWPVHDGILYVGGNLVLSTLTDEVPSSTGGIIADFVISCITLGMLAWMLALIGTFPVCDWMCEVVGGKQAHSLVPIAMSLTMLFIGVLPVVTCVLALVIALPLSWFEGWAYLYSFELAAGLLSHASGLVPPPTADVSVAGRMAGLFIAFEAVSVVLGVIVGAYLAFPFMDSIIDSLSRSVSGNGLLGKLMQYKGWVLIGIPLFIFPVSAMLGAVLAHIEQWSSISDGILYVGESMVLVPLTDVTPTTKIGKVFDFMVACFGIGVFGFTMAFVGALPFVDALCGELGGKSEHRSVSFLFTMGFFLVLMPITCTIMAGVLGAALALGEGWSFVDGWLFVASVLVQAPSLAPASAVPKTQGGQLTVFLFAVYSLCTTLGWGAGMVTASSSLDTWSKRILALLADTSGQAKSDHLVLVAPEAIPEVFDRETAESIAERAPCSPCTFCGSRCIQRPAPTFHG